MARSIAGIEENAEKGRSRSDSQAEAGAREVQGQRYGDPGVPVRADDKADGGVSNESRGVRDESQERD